MSAGGQGVIGYTAVIDHAFRNLAADRITSGTAAENGPSCRLLDRLGLHVVGEGVASFRKRADGTPLTFTGRAYLLSRQEWPLRRGTPPSPRGSAPR